MVKAQLFLVAALALLATPLETSAGIAGLRAAGNSISVVELFSSDDSSSSESGEEERQRPQPEQALGGDQDQSQAEPKDAEVEAIAEDAVEDEGLPSNPAIAEDDREQQAQQARESEKSWESRYTHGVVPARLPARENDKAHAYRHSIIHPYGDDLHA